jgi:hypothetical protein
MKIFLFLYPISPYFDSCLIDHLKLNKNANNNFRRINDIIEVRYRQRGYKIFWVMFSKEDNLQEPDLSIVSNYITIDERDIVVAAGVSFNKHISDKKYPDPKFIFNQIPEITELIVGGFHQWDCVNKTAKHAYEKGIPVLVDEDTTELFFTRNSLFGDMPLIREKITPEDLGLEGLEIGLYRKMREGKPWFVRI